MILTPCYVGAGTEVLVLHVVEPITYLPPPQMGAGYASELESRVKGGRKIVEQTVQKLRAAGFEADGAVENGDIREKIIDTAAQWHADLIAMGSHGRRAVPRFVLGSVAEDVARHAPYSVEIVRIPSLTEGLGKERK